MIHRWSLGLILGSLLCLASTARADEATRLYRQGVAAFEAGRFQLSLSLLRRARPRAKTTPLAAAVELYLGITHAVLGDEGKAKRAFEAALRHDPTLVLDANQHKPAIVSLFHEVRRKMRGYLSVERDGDEPAMVLIDGRQAGQTPYRANLSIGRHEVVVQDASGKELLSREVTIAATETTRVRLTAPLSKLDRRDRRDRQDRRNDTTRRRPRRKKFRRLWTWVAGGSAIVAAVVGIGFGVSALNDYDEYQSPNIDPERFNELAATIPDKVAVANVMYVTAGVLAAGAVALFFFEERLTRGRKRARSFDADLGPVIGPGTAGLSLCGRF